MTKQEDGAGRGGGLRSYLRSLERPTDWNGFADLLSKTLFAAASAAVAISIWIYSNHQSTLREALAEQEARHVRELQNAREGLSDRRDIISLFLQFLPRERSDPHFALKLQTLSSYCSEDTSGRRANRVLVVLCESVGQIGDSYAAETSAEASAAASRSASGAPGAYVESPAATAQAVSLAASEAAEPSQSNEWFAVIASVPLQQRAALPSIARELNNRLRAGGLPADIHVFRTRISRSFALTSGAGKTEALARARVRAVRQAGIVEDAFAQPNRGWTPEPIAF